MGVVVWDDEVGRQEASSNKASPGHDRSSLALSVVQGCAVVGEQERVRHSLCDHFGCPGSAEVVPTRTVVPAEQRHVLDEDDWKWNPVQTML